MAQSRTRRAAAAVLAGGLILAAGCETPARVRIGLRYPPLPAGWKEVSSAFLPAVAGGTDHAIAWVQTDSGDYLWLGRAVPVPVGPSPTAEGGGSRPIWELRDTLRLPALASDQQIVVAQCSLRRDPSDAEIAAIATAASADSLTGIVAAWRADRRSERFVPIATAGVACHNPGYGVD